MKNLLILTISLALAGCNTLNALNTLNDQAKNTQMYINVDSAPEISDSKKIKKQTIKKASNYGYYPLDPLPVTTNIEKCGFLEEMPDETIRIAVAKLSRDTGLTFGPALIGVAGDDYIVILDYIKFNTNSFPVKLEIKENGKVIGRVIKKIEATDADTFVPVYVGVGLRITANVKVRKNGVNLGSLFALGVAAKENKVSGTLVIQTLGVSGPEISGLIPMPGEINESTIQNAILSLASIKAKIYDNKTVINPRVVGVYNNLGGDESIIDGVISSLLQTPINFPESQLGYQQKVYENCKNASAPSLS